MFFTQLDTISEIEPGRSLQATKNLTLAEEYLQDHFPGFPVMPGVMMLEAMTQAAAWLIRFTGGFESSMVVLKEAKNVKYSGFVEPGETLHIQIEWMKENGAEVSVKASGDVNGRSAVSARLTLTRYNLCDLDPNQAATDRWINAEAQRFGQLLHRTTPK